MKTTKTLDKQTARFIASLLTCLPEIPDDIMQFLNEKPEALKKCLLGLNLSLAPNGLFSITDTRKQSALKSKLTNECFVPTWAGWAYGNHGKFDGLLPVNQPETGSCVITTLAASRSWTLTEGASSVLGIDTMDVMFLSKLLIKRGHTMTLTQAEAVTGGKSNLHDYFFVETGNRKRPVIAGCISQLDYCDTRYASPVRRDWDDYILPACSRLIIPNLDTAKLGL